MTQLLDCTNFDTTKESIANILDTSEDILVHQLNSIRNIPYSENPSDYIYSKVNENFKIPEIIKSVWFHGTRVEDPEVFRRAGILPKSEVAEAFWKILKSMSNGMIGKGENPFSTSFSFKDNKEHEGPFGVLFRDTVLHPKGFNRSYIDVPEIVEDIAGQLLGENFSILVEKYKTKTRPCIVSFIDDSSDYTIKNAIWYLHPPIQI